MKKRWAVLVLIGALLLCGCSRTSTNTDQGQEAATVETTEPTVPVTIPPDGDPKDVTCKGSYTGTVTNSVIAHCGDMELTNEQLQVWYWAEVAQYRQENHEIAPDFAQPLDVQICEIDSSVNSWQQYFLKQALSSWHSAQALILHSQEVPLSTEEAYQPNLANYEKYMTGMPAAELLYGYHSHYRPNSMHQAYLDGIPRMLESLARERGYANAEKMAADAFGVSAEILESVAHDANLGYMYFTTLSHYIEPTAEELEAYDAEQGSGNQSLSVDFRQILLVPQDVLQKDERPNWQQKQQPLEPVVLETVAVAADGKVTCSEEAWNICETEAQVLLTQWQKDTLGTEATFGETARKFSKDPGTQVNGGLYQGIRKNQMTGVLDAWCFDPARQAGDTAILRSDYGVHILYFSGSRTLGREESEAAYVRQQQNALIAQAKEAYPAQITYSAIALQEAEGVIGSGDLLYPDIAHERYPEIPLYLQQDYPDTMYGGFKITTNGCGITSFAMIASYLADDELTPPEMCERYGRYSHANGTDGMIFNYESPVLGFYLREKTYDTRVAKAALEEGHIVISIQHPGYWTRGGHYIVCESITEDGLVQVRDSNIYNYMRVSAHKEDLHKWGNITAAGSGYWIFEHKITRIPACSRCGDSNSLTQSLLNQEYTCEKCVPALLRRNTYLNN